MRETIIVVGHRNPDNDSICSAIAYAELKNILAARQGEDEERCYEPFRLGPLPAESEYVLRRFGVAAPLPLKHVHARVRDVMTPDPLQIRVSESMRTAALQLKNRNIRTLVTCDDAGVFRGIIDTQTFANLYLAELDEADPSSVTRFQTLARPISDFLNTDVPALDPEDLLAEARERVLDSALRQAVVLNGDGRCVGIVTRTDLARTPRRPVILVDHNEISQAVAGIREADVIEVVDHHRIGDIQTSLPIRFINLPLGSSASIVASEFINHGLKPRPEIAAVMLSAVLTDTVLLKSPTTTVRDRELAAFLADIANLDVAAFGREILEARFARQDGTVEGIVLTDSKEYSTGDSSFVISQYETIDTERFSQQEAEIQAFLADLVATRKLEFALLLLTDITREGSLFIVAGDARSVEKAFNVSLGEKTSVWVPGILSRKKQVAPRLLG